MHSQLYSKHYTSLLPYCIISYPIINISTLFFVRKQPDIFCLTFTSKSLSNVVIKRNLLLVYKLQYLFSYSLIPPLTSKVFPPNQIPIFFLLLLPSLLSNPSHKRIYLLLDVLLSYQVFQSFSICCGCPG